MRWPTVTRRSATGAAWILATSVWLGCAGGSSGIARDAIPAPPEMPEPVLEEFERGEVPPHTDTWVLVEVEGYFEKIRGMRGDEECESFCWLPWR